MLACGHRVPVNGDDLCGGGDVSQGCGWGSEVPVQMVSFSAFDYERSEDQ
jgi:hypothetical protein